MLADGVHHGLDSLPRLDSRLEYLLRRQQEAMTTLVSQLDRVDVRDEDHTGCPVTRVARRTV